MNDENYRDMMQFSPAAVLLHRDGLFVYANESACQLFGALHPDQLIGIPVLSVVPPESRELICERIEKTMLMTGQINTRLEEKVICLNGFQIDVEVVETHIIYQDLPTNQVIMLDISARNKARQLLKENEKTIRKLLDVMPVGVALMGIDGSIEYINHCFEESFGYSHAEIPTTREWGSNAYPDPDYRQKLVDNLESTLEEARVSGKPLTPVEVHVTCKDGSVRHVILNRQLAGDTKIAIHTDITERESQQNELLKIQKLESLGVLAGGIAHDFNNILTGILGNISFASMFLDESHKSYLPLANAEKAALRAAGLATQLLTFAKGGAPIKKLLSLFTLIEETVSLTLTGSNVKRVLSIPGDLFAIEADEGQICQAFHNVIINAVQAMPNGGILTVNAGNVSLRPGNKEGLPAGDYAKVSFADEGDGIPSEIQQKVFDPYFTTKPGGTGLGLTSAHSIATKHGGRVEVISNPRNGTVISFLLPALTASSVVQDHHPTSPTSVGQFRGKVLVMDDEIMILELAEQGLNHLGYHVTTCCNGEEAIMLYGAAKELGEPFLVAIMDLTIPGAMGGAEAARKILDLDPLAQLVVSSGYSNDPVMAQFAKYGFCASIAKPYKGSDLNKLLSTIPRSSSMEPK